MITENPIQYGLKSKDISSKRNPEERWRQNWLIKELNALSGRRVFFKFLLCYPWCIGSILRLILFLATAFLGITSRSNSGQKKKKT